MDEVFGIVVDMKTAGGFIEYCRFSMNTGEQIARETFDELLGLPDNAAHLPLRLSLVSFNDSPYEVFGLKYCRLDELGHNCRIITREIFKYYNLDN